MTSRLTNNKKTSTFEYSINGELATVTYTKRNEIIYLNYAFVPLQVRGQGIGAEMMSEVLEYVRENELKIVPICSYIVSYLRQNKKWDDLIHQP